MGLAPVAGMQGIFFSGWLAFVLQSLLRSGLVEFGDSVVWKAHRPSPELFIASPRESRSIDAAPSDVGIRISDIHSELLEPSVMSRKPSPVGVASTGFEVL